jgi:hypothetical protein
MLEPLGGVKAVVASGKALAAPRLPVKGTSCKVPPPARAVVVMVMTPVLASMATPDTFFVGLGAK